MTLKTTIKYTSNKHDITSTTVYFTISNIYTSTTADKIHNTATRSEAHTTVKKQKFVFKVFSASKLQM